jgi:hypothetical protein
MSNSVEAERAVAIQRWDRQKVERPEQDIQREKQAEKLRRAFGEPGSRRLHNALKVGRLRRLESAGQDSNMNRDSRG